MAGDFDLFDDGDTGENPYADAGNLRARDEFDLAEKRKEPVAERRAGRPKGATNYKTKDFEKFYQARGFKDPLVAQANYLTADPVELQAWFIEHERTMHGIGGKMVAKAVPSLFEIIKEQHAVADRLAPYLHGKKPVQVEIIDERLPTLIIDLGTNQLEQGQRIADGRMMSIGAPVDLEIVENQDVIEGEKVASHERPSHERGK
ncbi:hypothetical protein LJR231_002256 [Phyllobacterium sp. LjRoot231]|uniref:hypothetical protein n=1 Tax=Phyllobacterium sp. LjRoot231 TaxID=3342289 RepID=UPI003ED0BE54